MIDVADLRKQYGELVAVDGVTFAAEPSAIFGLLGPNGAGKSTIIGCLSGLLQPTSGRVRVLGHDVAVDGLEARRSLGVVPQELALYEDLSAKDNLSYWGAAYGLAGDGLKRRVVDVLERIGLGDRAREPVKRFSGGMKRRLNFGCAIVHRPKVLLLDEPTVGVDPQSRVRLLDLVREEVKAGACVLYTTHYMEEAQELCDRLAIIDHGTLLAIGTLGELRQMVGEKDLLRISGRFEPAPVSRALERMEGLEMVSADEGNLVLAVEGASRRLPAIFATVAESGGEIQETSVTQPSLETLFIKLTGRELRE
jgi:ABC-2 type transport system ATP-binding protein